ncbi:MAG: transporter [Alphaproteobacteria bacterium]|nr:transporter [Alphaproteobacteria bacterium]
MTNHPAHFGETAPPPASSWGAVFALTLCVSTLVAAEFMPVSLLTPMAADLHLTEGQAGQAISVSGVFAVFTALFIAKISQGIDRRALLLALTGLMLLSGVIATFAPNFPILLIGRALLGVVIGGFWSMSAATVIRLVPEKDVSRGLAVLNGGNALATTLAAPLGSFFGQYIGWRGAFFAIVPLAAATLLWLFATLPSMPGRSGERVAGPIGVLLRPNVAWGMAAVALFFMGQFTLFTYLRPFLETVTGVEGAMLSAMLLVLGVAGLVGTYVIGGIVETHLYRLLVALPLAMAVIAIALVATGTSAPVVTALLAAWGLLGTAAPVAWWTWLSKTLPDDAEAGGGLMVAVVQIAITAGAAGGGLLFDATGYEATFTLGAAILGLSALVAFLGWRAVAGERARADTLSPSY